MICPLNMKIVLWRRQAFDTSDDQIINTRPIGSDNVRASIVDPLDMDAFLPISCDEMTVNHLEGGVNR